MNAKICNNKKIEKLLYDYSLGRLDETEELSVEQHLADCNKCHKKLAEISHFTRWVKENPDVLAPRNTPAGHGNVVQGWWGRTWTWHRGMAAAAVILAMVSGPSLLVSYVAEVQKARFGFEVPKIDMLKGLGENSLDFQSGVVAFQEKNYRQALAHFSTYLKHSPDNFDANFFSGLCYLEMSKQNLAGIPYKLDHEQASQGIRHLEKARQIAANLQVKIGNVRYYADSLYFLGKAYFMIGDSSHARQCFQSYLKIDEPLLPHREEVQSLLTSLR